MTWENLLFQTDKACRLPSPIAGQGIQYSDWLLNFAGKPAEERNANTLSLVACPSVGMTGGSGDPDCSQVTAVFHCIAAHFLQLCSVHSTSCARAQ